MQDIIILKNNQEWKLISNIEKLSGAWITAEELGKKLGYSEPRLGVMRIYSRFSESFENKRDSAVVKLTTIFEASALGKASHTKQVSTRIFSERGALKIIRHSETPQANAIMDCVFDVFMEANRKDQVTKEFINRFMIEQMILPAPKSWQKAFPDGFGQAVFKLYDLGEYKPGIPNPVFARFVSRFIYGAAPEGVYEKLCEKNPQADDGFREFKHHQLLTDDAKTWLFRHIGEVTTLIRASRYHAETFKNMFAIAYPKNRMEDLEKLMLENTNIDIKQLLFDF